MDIKLASIQDLSNELLDRSDAGIIVLKPKETLDDGKKLFVNQCGHVYEILGLAQVGSLVVFNDNAETEDWED